ncbi:hypothetical protein P8452_74171 [Trifolium repens]|nr:hypothetical protein P8452_74171 [Trifolium repens]
MNQTELYISPILSIVVSSAALSCTFPLLQIFLFKQFLVTHDTMTPFVASVSGLLRSCGVFRSHSSIFSNSLSLSPIPAPAAHVDQSGCHHRVASMPPLSFCSLLSSFSVSSLDARGSYPQGQLCWQPAGEKVIDKT